MIKINDETLAYGCNEIKAISDKLRNSLIDDSIEGEEFITMISEDVMDAVLYDTETNTALETGTCYLRKFGEDEVVAFTFEDSDLWVLVGDCMVDYPSEWEYPEEFYIVVETMEENDDVG